MQANEVPERQACCLSMFNMAADEMRFYVLCYYPVSFPLFPFFFFPTLFAYLFSCRFLVQLVHVPGLHMRLQQKSLDQ